MFGISFKSKAEANHALWLQSEKDAGRIKSWEYEKKFNFYVEGSLVASHKPDFLIVMNDDRYVVHEIKGGRATMTDGWAIRRNLFEALNPYIKYEVFDRVRKHYIWGL